MLQKSGRLVLWEAMFILELHSAETQVLAWPDKQKQFSNPEVSIAVNDVLLTEMDSTVHWMVNN